jgi:hypothetical protein
MRNNPRDVVSVTEASIRTTDGKMHWIDPRAMLAAMDRAQKYLEEAVRWGKERASHLKSGNKKQDTRRHDQFLQRHSISKEVWFPINNEFDETDVMNVMAALHHWIEGTMDEFEADYTWLEEELDLDATYILFGIPIYLLSVESQQELRRIGAAFASRATSAGAALN